MKTGIRWALAAGVLVSGCQEASVPSRSEGKTSSANSVPAEDTVLYEVTGSNSVSTARISYGDAGKLIIQSVSLPWKKAISGKAGFLYLDAHSEMRGDGLTREGSVTCTITKNGQVVIAETASGYGMATCRTK